MARTMIVLHIVPGTPECGLWCDACLLPSRVRVPIYLLGRTGVSELAQRDYCTECG